MKKLFTLFAMVLLSALSLTANAATATIYIDRPSAVDFWIDHNGDWQKHELQAGVANPIEFNALTESTWEFDPINQNTGIYEITLNGVKTMNWNGEGYELQVKDGDVIHVVVDRPSGSVCKYTIVEGAEAIASVENSDTETEYTLIDNAFTPQPGDRIVLRPSPAYEVTSATLDGAAIQYIPASGCYFFVAADGEHTISVAATEKAEKQIVNVVTGNIDALEFYLSDSNWMLGEPTTVTDNQITVSSLKPWLQFKVAEGYELVAAGYAGKNGKGFAFTYDQWSKVYYVNAIDEKVTSINITTKEKPVERINATVWVEDVEKLSYYSIRTADMTFPYHSSNGAFFQNGDNTLSITAEQSPIRLYITFNGDPFLGVYLNDEAVSSVQIDEDNDIIGSFAIADGDVLKIYTDPNGEITYAKPVIKADSPLSDGPRFNMQGQRVGPAYKGIVIQNGRKTVVK